MMDDENLPICPTAAVSGPAAWPVAGEEALRLALISRQVHRDPHQDQGLFLRRAA
jgi:hypothetical protein